MGVQLNIKDAETVRMARDLADSTGQSVTAAIKAALKVQIDQREAEIDARRTRIEAFLDKLDRNRPPELEGVTSKQIMDSIYNEDGSFA
ncbi:type II toxin-antitoxin system VapB family antitoxin [Sphingomonas sp. PB4P5]|uniref:type II toxin-antitoxin system VapB family antitoxin n=1 Tax=Parasphingomonas puruogangriensis TaxID=3096155 RepID=UPI002FCB78CF